jgi:hypothetical protein
MKKESRIKIEDFEKALPAIQSGISSVLETRLHISELIRRYKDSIQENIPLHRNRSINAVGNDPDESLIGKQWLLQLETVISAASKGLEDLKSVVHDIETCLQQQHTQDIQDQAAERAKNREARLRQKSIEGKNTDPLDQSFDEDDENSAEESEEGSGKGSVATALFESRLLVIRKLKKDVSREQVQYCTAQGLAFACV